jgi:hypothetical protein
MVYIDIDDLLNLAFVNLGSGDAIRIKRLVNQNSILGLVTPT